MSRVRVVTPVWGPIAVRQRLTLARTGRRKVVSSFLASDRKTSLVKPAS